MKTKFVSTLSVAIMMLLCFSDRVYAQGGPTNAQRQAYTDAQTAQNYANGERGVATGDKLAAIAKYNMIFLTGKSSWTQAQQDTYNGYINNGNSDIGAGDTSRDLLGDYDKAQGDTAWNAGVAAWNMGQWATAAASFATAESEYDDATDDYVLADQFYVAAGTWFQMAIDYYNNN